MQEGEERTSGKSVPRSFNATTLLVSGMILLAPGALCLAENAPDNAVKTQGAENAATGNTAPQSAAIVDVAAIRDRISRTITSFGKDIQDAYHRQLIENPKIGGEINITFTVQPGGDVTDVNVDKSSLNWPPLEAEILNKVGGWKFAPFEGEPIKASVPYKFQSN